jgi:hypothetical protein
MSENKFFKNQRYRPKSNAQSTKMYFISQSQNPYNLNNIKIQNVDFY